MPVTDVLAQLKSIDRTKAAEADRSDPARVKALAAQFESMLLSQMMQQMRSSMFDSGDSESSNDSAPLADSLFSELSLALSRSGGMGLADSFIAPLMRETSLGPASAEMAGKPAELAGPGGISLGASAPIALEPPTSFPLATPSLAGRMSSAYGWRKDPIDAEMKFHRGVDIAMPVGNQIPSPRDGTVTFAGEVPGYGLTVVIDHGGSLTTRYAHLSEIEVKAGDSVQTGQVIAKSGATGRVTGPHLHFEVMEAGQTVNPAEKLPTYGVGGLQ
jgi:murein DD-endopeptidase MepM/ murein hydrolase activator NlpD